jgi:cell division protein FtsA
VGSALITSDISKMKAVSYDIAEKLKIEDGCCWEGVMDTDTDIPVPGVGGRPPMLIPRSQILAIVRPRMEEIFMMVKEKLDKVYYARSLGAGVVLTGGGALLAGAAELAASIFKAPVRIGLPLPVTGLAGEYRSPIFSTAIGLLLLGFEREQQAYLPASSDADVHIPRPAREKKVLSRPSVITRFFEWLGNDFV